jgi:adenylosuccinate lyase
MKDKTISGKLSEKEIKATLNPRNYLGTAVKQVDLAIRSTVKERKARQ